jgi:hypothetical protein
MSVYKKWIFQKKLLNFRNAQIIDFQKGPKTPCSHSNFRIMVAIDAYCVSQTLPTGDIGQTFFSKN